MKKRISCHGKVKHRKKEDAIIASKILKKNHALYSTAYKCRRCGFWHIGKPSFLDDPQTFWRNIFNQMSDIDKERLGVMQ